MKVVTYNIHKGMDKNNKMTLLRMIKYLKSLDANVICLQEVLYYQYKIMKFFLKMKGIFAMNVSRKNFKFGVCTFYKGELSSYSHVFLSSKKEQRGFLHIKTKLNDDNEINIINTHLGLDQLERRIQISEILNYSTLLLDKTIICGDFNEKNISMNLYNDTAVILNKTNIPTFNKSRIDYIFISKDFIPKLYEVASINYSDHFPVVSII